MALEEELEGVAEEGVAGEEVDRVAEGASMLALSLAATLGKIPWIKAWPPDVWQTQKGVCRSKHP